MQEKQAMPIYIVAGVAVLTLILVVVVMFKVMQIKPGEEKIRIVPAIEEMGPTYDLGEFVVNLRGSGYAKTQVVIELAKQEGKAKKEVEKAKKLNEEIKKREPQIRETILKALSSNTVKNLSGPEGVENLKILLLEGLQLVLGGGKLNLEINEKDNPYIGKTRENIEKINLGSTKIKNVYIPLLQTE